MALQQGVVEFLIRELLPRVNNKGRVMSLSRQKATSPVKDMAVLLESQGFSSKPLDGKDRITSLEIFQALGFDHYDDVDFTESESCTMVHDMNTPVPDHMADSYDLVFEHGTLEHIFDIKTAFANIVRMLKVGGTVFHLAPLDLVNHGFYNFSPTLYYDVYRKNGFSPVTFFMAESPERWWKDPNFYYEKMEFEVGRMKPAARKKYYPMLACIARKEQSLDQFNIPIQAIYDPETDFDPVF
ncbi:methyltransferase domain-containing protein [Desulfatibacillum aliphaticivorans]|uniref:methyltransferase domain-containing protein n=1 Tax=Desulfatibacillum aliphaticivorans TaxID=218208 RepID=UPI0003FA2C08|nr:methyltransferase domain-containing protein [Desulfatibacillum aliphaticivorans]